MVNVSWGKFQGMLNFFAAFTLRPRWSIAMISSETVANGHFTSFHQRLKDDWCLFRSLAQRTEHNLLWPKKDLMPESALRGRLTTEVGTQRITRRQCQLRSYYRGFLIVYRTFKAGGR